MKKKLIITSSLITILLALFPVSLYAEEVVQDPTPAVTSGGRIGLDSYFYDNYELLPYITSDGSQYINTGIAPDINTEFKIVLRDFVVGSNDPILFGSYANQNGYQISCTSSNGYLNFNFGTESNAVNISLQESLLYTIEFKDNVFSVNGHGSSYETSALSSNLPLYILNRNQLVSGRYSTCSLLSVDIYDSDQEEHNHRLSYNKCENITNP